MQEDANPFVEESAKLGVVERCLNVHAKEWWSAVRKGIKGLYRFFKKVFGTLQIQKVVRNQIEYG